MSVIDVEMVETDSKTQLEILRACRTLIYLLQAADLDNTSLAEELLQTIEAIVESGIDTEPVQISPEELAMLSFSIAKDEQDVTEIGENDEKFWQSVEDMIENYIPENKNGIA